jgi:hypothetical protein
MAKKQQPKVDVILLHKIVFIQYYCQVFFQVTKDPCSFVMECETPNNVCMPNFCKKKFHLQKFVGFE